MGLTFGIGNALVNLPDATTSGDGVMSSSDKTTLNDLASSRPAIANTKKTLTNNQATALFIVDMTQVADNSLASVVNFAVEVTDGTDVQIRSGSTNANVAKASNGNYTTSQAVSATNALTAGTLTTTFAWVTTATTATLQVTPASSLTPTEMHVNFYIPFSTHPAAVSVA